MSFICGGKTKLDSQMNNLTVETVRLLLWNNTLRSGLRRYWFGYKGIIDHKLLVWLDHVNRVEMQFIDICYSYISLLGLVEFIRVSPSSLLLFFPNRFFPELPTLRVTLIEKIKDKILKYLDDPLLRTLAFYGYEGWLKIETTNQIMNDLNLSSHKIVRVEVSPKTRLNNVLHLATQLNVQMGEDKCLFIFDHVPLPRIELSDKIWFARERVLLAGNEVTRALRHMYHRHLGLKIDKQILNLTNEVKVLKESFSSLLVLYDEDGADREPAQFTTQQTVSGKLAQGVLNTMLQSLLDPTVATIGLYGVGGAGKTTIIKQICNELANTDIFNMIIWVSLSKTKLDEKNYMRLQDEIANQLGIKLLEREKRASRISEKLKSVGKCLFILDDVWDTVSLSTIGIPYPERANGCKMVLTTRNGDVCAKMAVDQPIYLAPLSHTEAWDLFVSNSGDQVLDPEIKSIAQEIVYECGGLPITIITVCHVMKDQVNITAWRLALKDVRSNHRRIYGESMDHLFDVLLFGYNHLKNDQIRACFLCCAIFPEDHKFDSTELIRYWMVENLIHNEGGIVESINDGLEILKELKDANMLEIFMEGGNEWLKMHDLFRDLAIMIMRVELGFFIEAGVGLRHFDGTGKEKISLIRNQIYRLDLLHMNTLQNPCVNLSTLLLRDNPLYQISYSFFSRMPNLKVLDLSYSGLKELPASFSELSMLRVLFMDFCASLEKLPPLGNLKALQFLSLRGTLIKELPQGMEGLLNLKSFDLSQTIKLKRIEAGVISSLSNLEELHLQGSRLCKMKSPEVANLFKEISCLKQLGILTLSAIGFGYPLETILHLQQHNLKIFSVNAMDPLLITWKMSNTTDGCSIKLQPDIIAELEVI